MRSVLIYGKADKVYVIVVGFEFLTVVVVKSSIFYDISPCSLLIVKPRFGVKCRLHLQG
jgi:hypothetical protein